MQRSMSRSHLLHLIGINCFHPTLAGFAMLTAGGAPATFGPDPDPSGYLAQRIGAEVRREHRGQRWSRPEPKGPWQRLDWSSLNRSQHLTMLPASAVSPRVGHAHGRRLSDSDVVVPRFGYGMGVSG